MRPPRRSWEAVQRAVEALAAVLVARPDVSLSDKEVIMKAMEKLAKVVASGGMRATMRLRTSNLETCAKAVYGAYYGHPEDWDRAPEEYRQNCRDIARAVWRSIGVDIADEPNAIIQVYA